ncbi:hypothetical protein KD913_26710 [Klebsiella pneumoniae]
MIGQFINFMFDTFFLHVRNPLPLIQHSDPFKNNINDKAIANQSGLRIKETKIHDRQIINKKFHRYLFSKTEKPPPQKD